MKATVHVDGGPLDGSYAFDNYAPENLNNAGLNQGSNEFFAWLLIDGAFCFGKGQVGYVQGGVSPASMQRRLAGEQSFQAGPCNYVLTEWENKDAVIVARFRHIEWSEVLRLRAARSAKTRLADLKAKIESEGSGPPSTDVMNAVVAMIEAQQKQIDLLEPSRLVSQWTAPPKKP